ncbi:MAG: ATP-binding protein, partial [Nitrospirota bacterium]|nr:ATP-binding protein [Nitrospirota bacterium]
LSIAWWSFFEIWHVTASDLVQAVLWARLMEAGAFCIPTLFVHFVSRHLDHPLPRGVLLLLYLISGSIAILCWTPALIAGAEPRWYLRAVFQPGPLYWLAVFYFIACAAYAHYQLYRAYASSTGIRRNQLGYLWFSSVIGYIGGAGNFLLVFGIDVPALNPFGTYGVLLYVAGTSYAIVKYRLLDITVLLEKGLLSLMLCAIAAVSTYPIVLLAEWTYLGQTSHMMALIMVLLIAVALGLGYPIRASVRAAIFHKLFRYRYDRYQLSLAFPKSLDRVFDVAALSQKVTETFAELMHAQGAALFVFDGKKRGYVMTNASGSPGTPAPDSLISADDILPRHLEAQNRVVVRAEMEYEATRHQDGLISSLIQRHIDMCIPLQTADGLVAFCTLWGLRDYSLLLDAGGDALLSSLSLQAATKLDSALLHEEQKREHLLRMRNDRLRSLDIISAGFAHEIRNPLTSIKTFVQLAPDRSGDPEFLSSFSAIVADDVVRIERLIHEILDYARHTDLKLGDADLNDLVSSCVYFLGVQADARQVQIHKQFAPDLPLIRVDRQQMKQVIMNLCLNAFDAMPHGGVLTLCTRPSTGPHGERGVQIQVADTGSGIDAENLEHIFDPFFTTKHESGEREGTGLGLAIVHQIIHGHGGRIDVASTVGQGTSFTLTLLHQPTMATTGNITP